MSWNIKGNYIETCSCELECPCNLSMTLPATYDYCKVVMAFNIDEGQFDDVDLSGLSVVGVVQAPKIMAQGGWKMGMFVDENASEEQLNGIMQIFGGQAGGPMAGFAGLVAEQLGMERAPIEIRHDGMTHSVRVGDAIDVVVEDIVPGVAEGEKPMQLANMFHHPATHPHGVMTLAQARSSKIDAFGIRYEGKTALSNTEFSWAA
ncbi:MAG: DUF1326 domain-containing protein [Salinisphaera sp.]|nr:DUF1326 domain-containing protein [Salinisphaera sp.]